MSNRPELTGHFCVGANWTCRWVSEGGRCQKTLAPHYASRVYDKQACTAFNDGTVVHVASRTIEKRTSA